MRYFPYIFLVGLLSILLGLIIVSVGVSSAFHHDSLDNHKKFEAKKWANGSLREKGQMVNYLVDSIGIEGKSKKEIIRLLGSPEREFEGEAHHHCIVYRTDMGEPFLIEMFIYFDKRGIAKYLRFDD